MTRQLPSVEARQTDVDDGDVRLETAGLGEPRDAVLCLMHLVAVQLEPEAKHPPYIGAVLDKQDAATAPGGGSC